jgi:hypothetical protein
LNTKNNIAKEFIKNSVFSLDLDNSEVMVVWSLRHWASCSISGENPEDLFTLCREQHQLPDISVLIEEVVYGIAEGAEQKGPIGSELCDHVHYGEFKILEAICMLQNDKFEDAQFSLYGWLKPYQGRNVYKILSAFAAILEKANLIIPKRRQYISNWSTH